MQTIHFYTGEIEGSNNKDFSCYIEARTACEAENKLLTYYEENLMSSMGEIESIGVYDITANEYYGMRKNSKYSFI